jgi:hypothetical protein
MTRYVFLRCNGGHYFRSSVCPFDGWTLDGFESVVLAGARLGEAVSHGLLRGEGFSERVLRRAVVMEFLGPEYAFEAISPDLVVVDGQPLPLRRVPQALL